MSDKKKPYDPYGYNTPQKTNFAETLHVEEVIASADAAQADSLEDSQINNESLDKAHAQLEQPDQD